MVSAKNLVGVVGVHIRCGAWFPETIIAAGTRLTSLTHELQLGGTADVPRRAVENARWVGEWMGSGF